MTRKKGGGTTPQSQAIKSANKQAAQDVKAIQKHAKELLRKAGKDLRQVRSEVSALKKVGIVSSKIDARRYLPSRYMLSKLRKNADILSGEMIAIKAPKKVRAKYVEKDIFEQRGSALVVPRYYKDQKTKISRGMVEVSRRLKQGEEIRLILPFKATDMEDVANKLLVDPTLDGLKHGDELFGFRLFGHNMATYGFPDAADMADYILKRYAHLFSGKNGQAAVRNFELFKFKRDGSRLSEGPEANKQYTPRKKEYATDWYKQRKMERDAKRKKKERSKETPEQKKARLDAQRIRSAQNRQRKFDDS